jgi:hypothetical protein
MARSNNALKVVKTETIGSMTDQLFELRERKAELNKQISAIEAEYEEIEQRLIDKLKAEGTDRGGGKRANCSITTSVVANVEDWDALYPFIAKNKFWHLLQRRVSDPGMRELWEAGKKVPGVAQFTKTKLNFRVI